MCRRNAAPYPNSVKTNCPLDATAALTAVGRTSMDRRYKPDSVPLLGSVIYLSSFGGLVAINPKLTHSPDKPAQWKRRAASSFLFDLAPDGACHAVLLAENPAVSYTAFSPLPRACARGGLFSVALSIPFDLAKGSPRRLGRHPALRSPDFPLRNNP